MIPSTRFKTRYWMSLVMSTHCQYNPKTTQICDQQSLYKQLQNARMHQEESCKLKAMRQFRFGPYMTLKH